MQQQRLLLLVAVAAAIAVVVTLPGVYGSGKPSPISLGYYDDSASGVSMTAEESNLSYVSFDYFDMTTTGSIRGSLPSGLVAQAKAAGITTFGVFSNYDNGFNQAIAKAILTKPKVQATAISNIVAMLNKEGFDGVNIDFENVPASYRSQYTAFITALKKALGSSLLITSLPPVSVYDPTNSWSGAYDYETIGGIVDFIQYMTYDEYGPWGKPGPVSGLSWFTRCLSYIITIVPKEKISPGLPAYGYNYDLTKGGGTTLPYKDTNALLVSTKSKVEWETADASPYFYYTDSSGNKHVVWYENYESISAKVQAAANLGVNAISVWALGMDNSTFWSAVYP